MDVLKNLKLIRLRESILKVLPILILLISFYWTGQIFLEKEQLKEKYNGEMTLASEKKSEPEIVISEIISIDLEALEVLLYIAESFKYARVDVVGDAAIFEFNEDAFFETRDFEVALNNNKYIYNLQIAEGEGSWNGIRIEVKL